MMHYVSRNVYLGTGGLTFYTCMYDNGEVLSGTARKSVFWKDQKTSFTDFRRLGG